MEAQNPDFLYDEFDMGQIPAIETVRFPGEAVIEEVHTAHPEVEERPYQIDCLAALTHARRQGENRGLIHMATGLGKTTVAALDVKQFLRAQPNSRVIFVAHQNEILRQARDRFSLLLGDDLTYGMFTGQESGGEGARCVFASFQLLHRKKEDVFAPDDFDYMVVDESHHGKATTYEPSLLYFNPKFLLGMTATPDRRDLKEIRDIFGEEVYSKPLDEALSERLLARPNYHVILDDISELLIQGESRRGMEREFKQLNRRFFIPRRDEEIASIITKKLEIIENPKVIVFCPSVEHAERMAEILPNSTDLHSKLDHKEREERMDRFINNDITTVTTVDLFNEGIDIADANVVVFLRSTESEIIFQQQLGRGLRKIAGKESVLVLDFVANCDRLLMVDRVLGRHLENDNADITLDSDSEDLYDLDFSLIHNRNDINVEESPFNESTRQILELLRSIDRRSASLKPAPEDWVTVTQAAMQAEIAPSTAKRRIRDLGITAVRYLAPGGYGVAHIAEEDIAKIKQNIPDDAVTLQEASEVVGISAASVKTRLGHLGLSTFRVGEGHSGRHYVQGEDIKKVQATIHRPDGLLNLLQASSMLEVTPITVVKQAERLGLSLETYYGDNGRPASYVSLTTMKALEDSLQFPDDVVRVRDIANELGISQQTIFSRAKKLGISVISVSLSGPGAPTPVMDTTDFVKFKKLTTLPDGWLRYEEAAKKIGIGRNTLITRVEELGLTPVTRQIIQGPKAAYISPEDFVKIQALYRPPEGWKSVLEISKEYGIPTATLNHRLAVREITTQKYPIPNSRPTVFVAAEDIEKLVIKQRRKKHTFGSKNEGE